MEAAFKEVYTKFKLHFYQELYGAMEQDTGELSVMETLAAEIIFALGSPTISEFAHSIGISRPSATYRVHMLEKKGSITRTISERDRREQHLHVTQKFIDNYSFSDKYIGLVCRRMEERFSLAECSGLNKMLEIISSELMPEGKTKSGTKKEQL